MLIVSLYGGQLKPGSSLKASARCLIMLIRSINKRQDGCGENATLPDAPAGTSEVASGLTGQRQLATGDRPISQDVAAELEEFCRPARHPAFNCSRVFHQRLLLNEAAEVLFMQKAARQGLKRLLQLPQGE